MRNYSSRASSRCPCLTGALRSTPAQSTMECGGLPPLSSRRNVRRRNELGEACLARYPAPLPRAARTGALLACRRFSLRTLRSYLRDLWVQSFALRQQT